MQFIINGVTGSRLRGMVSQNFCSRRTFSTHAAVFLQMFSIGSVIRDAVKKFDVAARNSFIVYDFMYLHSKLFH